ncbi:hypothetical protein UFOVP1361_52 [uncultured Caudovirales phage]|uniref:Uncharacterized protein n=1 Tax=uncultured Caudovirales phage TaxID=2100421 RepID=A0A6J5RUF9_9CAUD|nr:hypothetical protein UFOVP1361_52 [uncultured Caudovirales phage]
MLKKTKEKLLNALEKEKAGQLRAKMVRLLNLRIDEDIANSIIKDHRCDDGILRDCMLLDSIGAAECNGFIYTFEDGSSIEIKA